MSVLMRPFKLSSLVLLLATHACIDHGGRTENHRSKIPAEEQGAGPAASAAPVVGGAASGVFLSKVDPILRGSCGTARCHGDGASFGVFVGNESLVRQKATTIVGRVRTGAMPVPGSGITLSADGKAKLLAAMAELSAVPVATPTPDPSTPTVTPAATDEPTTGPTTATRPRECPPETEIAEPAAPLEFVAAIDPILTASCSGGTCHSQGSASREIFVGNEAKFTNLANGILYHLKRDSMPPGAALSTDDKTKIYQFLCR